MAHHPRPDPANERHAVKNGPRLTALLAVATATGLVAVLLALRVLDVAGDLPSPRFETYLEIPLVGTGSLLAAWVSLSAVLAASCVLVRTAGRRWAAGERLVLQHAPAVIHRLASSGVAVSIGAGLVLGAGSAQAAERDPAAPAPSPVVVDLGWQSTAHGSAGPSAPAPGTGPSNVRPDPAAEETAGEETPTARPGPDHAQDDAAPEADASTIAPGASPPLLTEAGRPAEPASAAEAPQPDGTDAPSTPPSALPALPAPPQPGGTSPDHVPLSGLLGGTQRALPGQHAGVESAASSSGATRPEEAAAGTASSLAESDASTVSIVVLRGDSLWSLAERALGQGATDAAISTEWQRWYTANAETIGQDPDLIRPGQVLQAPRAP